MKCTLRLLYLFLLFYGLNLSAENITVTFEDPVPEAPVECGDMWSENGVDMQVVVDNGCNWIYSNGQLELFGAALSVDLSPFTDIPSISITSEGVFIEIYDIDGDIIYQYFSFEPETVVFNNSDNLQLGELFIVAYNGEAITEFTLNIPNECELSGGELIGVSCDDGVICTVGETWDENCQCTGGVAEDNDGDGFCSVEDPDDSDPCVPDENNQICIDLTQCDMLYMNDFENGAEGWIDGGPDAIIRSFPFYAFSGEKVLRLRDNNLSSTLTSPSYDLSMAEDINVSFTYVAVSMDNANEDFWLQISEDGAPFEIYEEWNLGDEFENEIREFVDLTIPGPLSADTRFRLRCDASSNGDLVYIDDLFIEGCVTLEPPTCDDGIQNGDETGIDCGANCGPCPCLTFNFNDFEFATGIWNLAGSDAVRVEDAIAASSGLYSVRLRDDSNTSFMTTNDIDAEIYGSAEISFSFFTRSFDTPDEDFWLQVSTDGGESFTAVEEWNYTDEFINNVHYETLAEVEGPFTSNTQFRLRCDASSNGDRLYIDDLLIEFCDETEDPDPGMFGTNTTFANQVTDDNQTNETIDNSSNSDLALIRSTHSDLEFIAYPNPVVAGESIFMEVTNPDANMSYEVIDQIGRTVSKSVWNDNYEMIELSTDGYLPGHYTIKLVSSQSTRIQKFLLISN